MNSSPQTLQDIVNRLGMFCPMSRDGVVGFITGLETGMGSSLSNKIIDFLVTNKGFEQSSDSWPGMVQVLSDRISISWLDGFKLIINEMPLIKLS